MENGPTAPDAFPTDTIVPLRFINLKLLSKLMELDMLFLVMNKPKKKRIHTYPFQRHQIRHQRLHCSSVPILSSLCLPQGTE